MNSNEHYNLAEAYLMEAFREDNTMDPVTRSHMLAAAQVHATLALRTDR